MRRHELAAKELPPLQGEGWGGDGFPHGHGRARATPSPPNPSLEGEGFKAKAMKLCGFEVGLDQPIFLIAGPCVIESMQLRSEEHTSELQSLMRTSSAVFC